MVIRGQSFSALLLAAALIFLFANDLRAQANKAVVCDAPKSGVIPFQDGAKIDGPIMITMLQRGVDPAAVSRGYIVWSKANVWISIDEFKGPLFVEDGTSLVVRKDWTKGEVVWSGLGCR